MPKPNDESEVGRSSGLGLAQFSVFGTTPKAAVKAARVLLPGLVLCVTIAMAAAFLSEHYGGPLMLFALLLGMALNPLSDDGPLMPGVVMASRVILKIGVALLGVRITTGDVFSLGFEPVALAVGGVSLMLVTGCILARLSGKPLAFGILTGGAVGICGASAALALASVLPKGKHGISERDTIFTVLAVTTLSTVAMVIYPIVADLMGLDDRAAGVFIGATVHDVAQVVGAGYSISTETGDVATVTKLFRVALLVPVIALLTLLYLDNRHETEALDGAEGGRSNRWFGLHRLPHLPAFLVGFVILVALNSLGTIPAVLQSGLSDVSRWCLVAAIAALGIRTSLRDIGQLGPIAMGIVVVQTLLLMVLALAVVA